MSESEVTRDIQLDLLDIELRKKLDQLCAFTHHEIDNIMRFKWSLLAELRAYANKVKIYES